MSDACDEIRFDLVVMRYGELFLKGANRHHFEQILLDNVKRMLRDLPSTSYKRGQGRLFVSCPDSATVNLAVKRLRGVFGVTSLSPAVAIEQDFEQMTDVSLRLVRQYIEQYTPSTFRVSCRRADKQFEYNSMEVNRLLGQQVVERTGLAVNLDDPGLEIGVELGPERSFVFTERFSGAGGLPVGVSGKVGLLLSGGIDSPVAGYLMQKRGCVLVPIYFHAPPYTGSRTQDKVEQLAAVLAPAQARMELVVVHFTPIQLAIRDCCPKELAVVLYRRMMMRIASIIARENRCEGLASGENLGQVASQTLANMACIEEVASLPVLRPLLTFDKAETIGLARRIKSYELSIAPYDDCCSLFVPKHPITRCKLGIVKQAEEELEIEALVEEAVASAEKKTIEPLQ